MSTGPAEVVGAKTTVEVSTVAEMLVSKVALLGFLIVVNVEGGTTASTRAPACPVANERHSASCCHSQALFNVSLFHHAKFHLQLLLPLWIAVLLRANNLKYDVPLSTRPRCYRTVMSIEFLKKGTETVAKP